MANKDFPPGTQLIEDLAGQHILLAPQPGSDPNQPLASPRPPANWSKRRKTLHLVVLGFYTLLVFSFLTVPVPLWVYFNLELGISYTTLNTGFAVSQATLATGCVLFIPLALQYGRRPIYIVTALILLATGIWEARMMTAADNVGSCALLGLASCVNEALFQITVTDLFFVHQRGSINGIYLAIVMTGNYLAPVASGYVAVSSLGWRWAFWLCTIFIAVCIVVMVCLLEETKYTAKEGRGPQSSPRAKGQEGGEGDGDGRQEAIIYTVTSTSKDPPRRGETSTERVEAGQVGSLDGRSRRLVEIDHSIPLTSLRERLALMSPEPAPTTGRRSIWNHVYQPFVILFTFPAVLFTAVQWGFLIAMVCILSITQALIYPRAPYYFSSAGVGNMNIAPAVGCILGSVLGGPLNDYLILRVAKRRGGVYEPETRLWLFPILGLFMPAGTLLYGLTIAQGVAWPSNAVGAAFIGVAIGGCGDIALTYCQDCYQHILGDALTAVVFVRNIISCGLVFAITPWMEHMGVYNMFVLLGCVSVAVLLTCVPLIVWGRTWRVNKAADYGFYALRQT